MNKFRMMILQNIWRKYVNEWELISNVSKDESIKNIIAKAKNIDE